MTVRVEVESTFESLSKTITDFETQTDYNFNSTQKVKVLETEILITETFHPLNN